MMYLAKAAIGALISAISTFLSAYAATNHVDVVNILSGVTAGLVTFNAVYFTPYAPQPPKPTPAPLPSVTPPTQ